MATTRTCHGQPSLRAFTWGGPLGATLVLLLTLVGCAESRTALGPATPPIDRSLLGGGPCAPPCWQGLTPGESDEDDVRSASTVCL